MKKLCRLFVSPAGKLIFWSVILFFVQHAERDFTMRIISSIVGGVFIYLLSLLVETKRSREREQQSLKRILIESGVVSLLVIFGMWWNFSSYRHIAQWLSLLASIIAGIFFFGILVGVRFDWHIFMQKETMPLPKWLMAWMGIAQIVFSYCTISFLLWVVGAAVIFIFRLVFVHSTLAENIRQSAVYGLLLPAFPPIVLAICLLLLGGFLVVRAVYCFLKLGQLPAVDTPSALVIALVGLAAFVWVGWTGIAIWNLAVLLGFTITKRDLGAAIVSEVLGAVLVVAYLKFVGQPNMAIDIFILSFLQHLFGG